MDADFSIELGKDDPVLDFPWKDPDGEFHYFDLKHRLSLLSHLPELQTFPELGDLLRAINSVTSLLESAKCDAWSSDEISASEEIFGATHKVGSYVDVIFCSAERRYSLVLHELFAKRLIELLRRIPETPSAMELCIRRCYFGSDADEGFYLTIFLTGYGSDESRARQNWTIALRLVGGAILQLSAAGLA